MKTIADYIKRGFSIYIFDDCAEAEIWAEAIEFSCTKMFAVVDAFPFPEFSSFKEGYSCVLRITSELESDIDNWSCVFDMRHRMPGTQGHPVYERIK